MLKDSIRDSCFFPLCKIVLFVIISLWGWDIRPRNFHAHRIQKNVTILFASVFIEIYLRYFKDNQEAFQAYFSWECKTCPNIQNLFKVLPPMIEVGGEAKEENGKKLLHEIRERPSKCDPGQGIFYCGVVYWIVNQHSSRLVFQRIMVCCLGQENKCISETRLHHSKFSFWASFRTR